MFTDEYDFPLFFSVFSANNKKNREQKKILGSSHTLPCSRYMEVVCEFNRFNGFVIEKYTMTFFLFRRQSNDDDDNNM